MKHQKSILLALRNNQVEDLVRRILTERGFEVIEAEAKNLILLVQEHKPDFLLISAAFDCGTDGIEICRQVRATPRLATKCVVFFESKPNELLRASLADISGYLYENAEIEEIETVFSRLSIGDRYINSEIRQALYSTQSPEYQKYVSILSVREREIFRHVGDGDTTPQIAEKLFIDAKTVETHKYNTIKKLGLKGAGELKLKAMQMIQSKISFAQ